MVQTEALQVLLVEDNPEERWLLGELLRSRGHTVTACENAETGWQAFLQNLPPLVLLDWVLPGQDGIDLLRRIRAHEGTPRCVVMVVTGKSSPEDLREVMEAGADDYVAKPLDMDLLEIRLAIAEERVRNINTREVAREVVEEELSARNLELLTLNRISELTLASPDLEKALPRTLDWIIEGTGFPIVFLERLDSERDRLVLLGQQGMPEAPDGRVEVPVHESIGALAAERRQPLAVEDARSHPRFRDGFLRRQGLRSYVAFPLIASDRALGVLTLADTQVREIPLRLLHWGESLANLLAAFIERVEAEAALREGEHQALKLANELRQANEELEAFAYSVSHDLRAPLRTMQGFAHTLLREHGNSIPPQARDFSRRIVESGKQMEGLIRDLLAYSRMSFEELELQEVDLSQAFSDAREQVGAYLSEREARLTLPDSFPTVLAHHTTLVQVLANLLSNAVKFVPDERTPEIGLSWEESEQDGSIRLSVQDNGVGIPSDQLERIFKVFERLEGEVTREGTGIGLAIVRRGMDRVGGRVGVTSTEGEGSCFWVEVPKGRPRGWRPWGGRRGRKG